MAITYNKPGDTTACVYNIWPSDIAVPAGDNLIITETAGGGPHGCTVSTGQMDGSDIGPNGSDWAGNCNVSGIIPSVALTVNSVKKTFHDNGQVLNTGGIDANSCGHPNEFIQARPPVRRPATAPR